MKQPAVELVGDGAGVAVGPPRGDLADLIDPGAAALGQLRLGTVLPRRVRDGGEGVAQRRTPLIAGGRIANLLYDTRTAREANAQPTGSGRRAWTRDRSR